MELFEQYGIDLGYVVLGMAGVIFVMLIMLIVTMAKNASMRKKYKIFSNFDSIIIVSPIVIIGLNFDLIRLHPILFHLF